MGYAYDASGQIQQVQLTAGGSTTVLASGIQYQPFGPVSNLTYGNGLTMNQSLDTAYRLTDVTAGSALSLTGAQYDVLGNLTGRTDDGTPTTWGYDALSRLDVASGLFGSRDYAYDKNGNRSQLIADGQTTGYSYEPASNRLASDTVWSYTRDANGNTTEQLASDGTGRLYAFNSHNRLIMATDRSITLEGKGKNKTEVITDTPIASYAYNGLGQRVSKDVSGTVAQYVYGTNGELLAELDAGGEPQVEYVYFNGQLLATVAVTTTVPSGNGADVTLDNGEAGTSSTGSWTSTTDRKNKQVGADYLVAAGGTGSTYRWTPTLTAGSYEVFAWWVADRKAASNVPFTVAHNGITSSITVDQTGSSAQWVSLGVYDFTGSGSEYIEVSDANGKAIADAVRLVEQVDTTPQVSTDVYYVHNDHLGTPQAMTDASGAVVWRADYDPFGAASIDDDVDGDGTAVTLHVRFPGQYYDQETGLHYNYFRYYDPNTGRYLTSDPIGITHDYSDPTIQAAIQSGLPLVEDGFVLDINHLYAYAEQNPLIYVDPNGLMDQRTWKRLRDQRPRGNLGNMISDPNGNLWTGTKAQDWRCTLGPGLGALGDACFPERCIAHDQCYEDNDCNYSSWFPTLLGGTKPCNKCNSGF